MKEITNPEFAFTETSSMLFSKSKSDKGSGLLRLVEIFKNDKYPAIRNLTYTASFISDNAKDAINIPFTVKFIPKEGTYTAEEW